MGQLFEPAVGKTGEAQKLDAHVFERRNAMLCSVLAMLTALVVVLGTVFMAVLAIVPMIRRVGRRPTHDHTTHDKFGVEPNLHCRRQVNLAVDQPLPRHQQSRLG